jgi:hypothetical protein
VAAVDFPAPRFCPLRGSRDRDAGVPPRFSGARRGRGLAAAIGQTLGGKVPAEFAPWHPPGGHPFVDQVGVVIDHPPIET